MNPSRVSVGRTVAAGFALALLLVMFLPWYALEASVAGPGDGRTTFTDSTANAWQAFSLTDLVLLVVVVLAVAAALTSALGTESTSVPPPALVAAAGTVAVVLSVYRLIDSPGAAGFTAGPVEVEVARRVGAFLAPVASAGIALGGFRAMGERAGAAG